MTIPSLVRIGAGLGWAIAFGVPFGILVGRFRTVREASSVPFQFLRMISPLAWMPIAVMAFATWDRAIIFLVGVAAVWPILFSTAHGFRRIDPAWFKVARNLGARPWHMLLTIILPAIAQDALTGIRLAVGVAWIVLVPAEFLGVTSGLGYSINDARDALEYDRLRRHRRHHRHHRLHARSHLRAGDPRARAGSAKSDAHDRQFSLFTIQRKEEMT